MHLGRRGEFYRLHLLIYRLGGELNPLNKKSETNPKENRSLGRRIESDFDEEGTEIYEVPQVSKFEYEIDIAPSSFSLGSLFSNVASQEENSTVKKKRGRPKKNNVRKQ